MTHLINVSELKTQIKTIEICEDLVNAYNQNNETKVIIDFAGCDFIYPDYVLILVCAIKYLENIGFNIHGTIKIKKDSNLTKYLASMDFFENLKVEFPFKIQPINENNSVKIQRYTSENQIEVLHSILKVLKEHSALNENVYTSLDYCLNEILDNVLNHSEKGEGWVVAQYFENLNSIRLIEADYGIGSHKSLNQKHQFSQEKAMLKCIEEGISNGKGQGHGLYATTTFVKLTRGFLSIASGHKKLNVTEINTIVKDIPKWNGTYVYFRINTNVDVDYTTFTSRNYDYKKQVFEDLFD